VTAPVRTVFLGSGGFGRPALEALASSAIVDLVGVVTAPPRPAGRSARLTPTVIEASARSLGIDTVQVPSRLRDPQAVAAVLALRPGLIVLADYGQIVPADLLEVRHGALNLHPSLLPRHRGATPVPASILAGDEETGVSLMRMDAGLDTGPIVAQARVALDGTEVAPALEARLADIGAALLLEWLEPWLAGQVVPRAQDDAAATLTGPFRRSDGRLDPARTAVELERRVRALQPWPGSFLETELGRIVVWSAAVDEAPMGSSCGRPGVFDGDGVRTADGHLRLLEVQPAGGKRMPWDAFVRGRPAIIGSSIVA
jgi:methionyl-tRNA formyltransferase